MYDKHYYGQGFSRFPDKCVNSVTVRLSDKEIAILERYFPDSNRSYQIRSLIHAYDKIARAKT